MVSYAIVNSNKSPDGSQVTTSSYNTARQQLDAINSNINTAKTILDQQISYSDLITTLAGAMPSGTILDRVVVAGNQPSATISFTVKGRTAESLAALQNNMIKLSILSNYSQSTPSGSGGSTGYPVTVTATANVNRGVSL